MLTHEPTKQDIIEAHKRIKHLIYFTPIFSSRTLNSIFECKIFFKCENFQRSGSFKFRGACNAVLSLNKGEWRKGVATHSSGNHAAALALAAKLKNMNAYVVMPKTAPQIKKTAAESYGAKITYCDATIQSREETLAQVVVDTGAAFVHPYDNYSIIAGQATCAREILEEITDLDFLIAPVSGGGLISGTSLSVKYFAPRTRIIGAEPKGADDAYRSMKEGSIQPSENPQTICDGLQAQLSRRTFPIIQTNVSEIITVDDTSTITAMRMIWERMKIIVEPSAAITLGTIIENKRRFKGKRIGLILSGGNADLEKLPWQ